MEQHQIDSLHIREYTELARRALLPTLFENNNAQLGQIVHTVLGINTEVLELLDAIPKLRDSQSSDADILNFIEEIGDICWYHAVLSTTIKWQHLAAVEGTVIEYKDFTKNGLLNTIAILTDKVKRLIAYGKPLDLEFEVILSKLWSVMMRPKRLLATLHCEINDITNHEIVTNRFEDTYYLPDNINEIMFLNIEKLKNRFPEKFSTDNAINRDTVKELDIIARLLRK